MGECVLTRRSVVKNEYQKLADIIVSGSAVTQVDISGLNIGKGEEVVLVSEIDNPTGSIPGFRLYANDNYTDTNYWTQALEANGTTITGARNNIASCLFAQANSKTFINVKIKLTNNGYYVLQLDGIINNGLSSMYMANRYTTSTFTLTSITSLRFYSTIANSIGIGSRFILYKVGG